MFAAVTIHIYRQFLIMHEHCLVREDHYPLPRLPRAAFYSIFILPMQKAIRGRKILLAHIAVYNT